MVRIARAAVLMRMEGMVAVVAMGVKVDINAYPPCPEGRMRSVREQAVNCSLGITTKGKPIAIPRAQGSLTVVGGAAKNSMFSG